MTDFWDSIEAITEEHRKIPAVFRNLSGLAKHTFHANKLPSARAAAPPDCFDRAETFSDGGGI